MHRINNHSLHNLKGENGPISWLPHSFDDPSTFIELLATFYPQVVDFTHVPIYKTCASSEFLVRRESNVHTKTVTQERKMQNAIKMMTLEEGHFYDYFWTMSSLHKHLEAKKYYNNNSSQLYRSRKLWIQEVLKIIKLDQRQFFPFQRVDIANSTVDLSIGETSIEGTACITQSTDAHALSILAETCVERREKKIPYFDASILCDPIDLSSKISTTFREQIGAKSFPDKLYQILVDGSKEGNEDSASFLPHGRAFIIHNTLEFSKSIMPKYFKHNRLNSFRRQLSLYGFARINSGPDTGGYYHELFLRGRPALVSCIRRVGVVKAVPRVRGIKPRGSTVDPDFYSMREINGAVWPPP